MGVSDWRDAATLLSSANLGSVTTRVSESSTAREGHLTTHRDGCILVLAPGGALVRVVGLVVTDEIMLARKGWLFAPRHHAAEGAEAEVDRVDVRPQVALAVVLCST